MERTPKVRRRWRLATPRVHARGEARLDAMLDLVEQASRSAPLGEVLAGMAQRIAGLLGVDVTSVYLREPESDELVMQATFGYPAEAVGQVRLAIGEGLTGFCVECLRPVSVARATFDARNRSFPGLDEERFPSLCAVPLVDGGRAVGALVVQRRQPRAFGEREVVLIASLCSPVLLAVERARTRRAERALDDKPRTGRPLDVMLQGAPAAPGEGLGVARVRRDVELAVPRSGAVVDVAEESARLTRAVVAVAGEVSELEAWALDQVGSLESRARLRSLLLSSRGVLDDMLLQERMQAGIGRSSSRGLMTADESVDETMQAYTRSLLAMGDPMLLDRAVEMEALCLRIRARLSAPAERLPTGRVWCAGRLPVCDALSLARAHAAGVVLTELGVDGATAGTRVAAALGLPVVVGVGELFRWVVDGDRLLLDGGTGRVIINPGRPEVAALRQRRRDYLVRSTPK